MTKDKTVVEPTKKIKKSTKDLDKLIAKAAVEIFFIGFAAYGLRTTLGKDANHLYDGLTAFVMILLVYIKVS